MGRIVYVVKNPLAEVSIIIPCKREEDLIYREKYPQECEVMAVVGDEAPGRLRDYGALFAVGDYLAFIDSDAYPREDWYKVLIKVLPSIDIMGGPGILPPGSSALELLSDLVLRCLPYRYRVVPSLGRKVAEFPTFNLVIDKSLFDFFGGFNTDMLTGEDSIFCRKFPYGVFYNPRLVVYHKRRRFGMPFFKQIAQYGKNRGLLVAVVFPFLPVAILITLIIYGFFFLRSLLWPRS